MCGRYVLMEHAVPLAEQFALFEPVRVVPRYNLAPTQDGLVVVVQDEQRVARSMRWGLVPWWAKDPAIGAKMINARAETVAEKRAFRESFEQRRCLVPISGFFEWKASGPAKQPHLIRAPGEASLGAGQYLAAAGVWSRWKSPEGEPLESYSIITTEANALMAQLHDRMPLFLPPEAQAPWLDPESRPEDLQPTLQAPVEVPLRHHPVDPRVGRVDQDDERLVEPWSSPQLTFF